MQEYVINDVISYGTHGVCQITDMTNNIVAGKERRYYVLKPINDPKATVFVPTDSQKLLDKFRQLLSPDEIHSLIDRSATERPHWVNDENTPKDDYQHVFSDNSLDGPLWLIKTLHPKREERKNAGKRLCVTDENFMKKAEKLLYGELSYVLNIEPHEVWAFICNRLGETTNEIA